MSSSFQEETRKQNKLLGVDGMRENKKAEEYAQNRFKVITPVLLALDEGADAAKLAQVKREVCKQNGISRRTLMRWIIAHQKDGYNGLKPVPRFGGVGILPEELIQEAIVICYFVCFRYNLT
jgi:hypothetical protein